MRTLANDAKQTAKPSCETDPFLAWVRNMWLTGTGKGDDLVIALADGDKSVLGNDRCQAHDSALMRLFIAEGKGEIVHLGGPGAGAFGHSFRPNYESESAQSLLSMSWPECPQCAQCLAKAYKAQGVFRLKCLFPYCNADFSYHQWTHPEKAVAAKPPARKLPELKKPAFPGLARSENPEVVKPKQPSLFGGGR